MIRAILLFAFSIYCNILISQHVSITQFDKIKLFQWQENHLKILVEGHWCTEIVVTATTGHISLDTANCELIYTAADTSIHSTTIKIGIVQGKSIHWVEELTMPVFESPDPILLLLGHSTGDTITKTEFLIENGIKVSSYALGWEMMQMDHRQKITHYSVKITRKDSIVFSLEHIDGYYFPQELINFVNSSILKYDEIEFYDMDALIYNQELRHLKENYKLIIW